MTDDTERSQPQDDNQLQERILSTSGGMVGVCATLIGLVKVVERNGVLSHVDEYAGCTAVIFVFSAYLAIRAPRKGRVHSAFGAVADLLFVVGLIALAAISLMFAYDLI